MPELPEVERYRVLAESALERAISSVDAPDTWFLKRGLDPPAIRTMLTGRAFTAARRIGKLLLLDVDAGPVLGLRFGMSGRLIVDGTAAVDDLLYSPNRDEQRWDRFVVHFDDGGSLRVRDPRRLGGVEVDPDVSRLGPDALTLSMGDLRRALADSAAPVKARLLDQARVAGIGNLLGDEMLWRAGIDPSRPSESVAGADLRRLHRHLRGTVDDLLARGGSHRGDFLPFRVPGGTCPRDGSALRRATVGGRTTWWCPAHQR